MRRQIYNPILPINKYTCDPEMHVFSDRVYLIGSQDKENGDTYCMLDYCVYSAPIDDLANWTCKGVSYAAKQDPLYEEGYKYMYAPDIVCGNDGRYYLYYCMSGYRGRGGYSNHISVAVSNEPDGKYEYLGFVKNTDGAPLMEQICFDPAVINDDGVIRLYYGTNYPWFEGMPAIMKKMAKKIVFGRAAEMGSYHVQLQDDMLTIATKPVRIDPVSKAHPFFEASSIRKKANTYYFVYSSSKGHELCYATSSYPDRDFEFRGTLVSNGDIGYQGRKPKERLNTTGTNHGCIEYIGGKWYVFYHRNTNKTAYSRQVCAEPIEILDNGIIKQVEVTTQGINSGVLKADGSFPASTCCNLYCEKVMPHIANGITRKKVPFIVSQSGGQFVRMVNKSTAVYKYFDLSGGKLTVTARGKGKIIILAKDITLGEMQIDCQNWSKFSLSLPYAENRAVSISTVSKKYIDIKELRFDKK